MTLVPDYFWVLRVALNGQINAEFLPANGIRESSLIGVKK
jgi:hypothetical protein